MFTYQGGRRQDEAARHDSLPVELRSDEEVSGAGDGLRRSGVGEQHAERALHDAERRSPSTASSCSTLDSRATPGHGQATCSTTIYLKLGQTEMDDMAEGVKALWSRAVHRQESRRHLRHVVRRLHVGDGDPAASRGVRGRVVLVAADRLAQLRHDLHRAVHVDSAGEQGGLRQAARR